MVPQLPWHLPAPLAPRGYVRDDTHGQVDNNARYSTIGTIVAAIEHKIADEIYLILTENLHHTQRPTARRQALQHYRSL